MKRIFNCDPRIQKKKEILEPPIIVRVNEFTESSAKTFAEEMQNAHDAGQPIIPVLIDSYGGFVDSLVAMISEIENSKIPVATICQGKAMSCGSILLSCGAEGHRYIDPNSRVMIHDVSNMVWGKTEEVKATAAEQDRLSKLIFRLMAKNCGHRDKNYFLKLIHDKGHADWFLTAKETKKHKIVNHLRVPDFKVEVSVDMTLE
jgi:ATP-dependent Clp protease protease subunit